MTKPRAGGAWGRGGDSPSGQCLKDPGGNILSQVWSFSGNWECSETKTKTLPHPQPPSLRERRTNTGKTLPMADLAQDSWEDINGDNTVNTSPEVCSRSCVEPSPILRTRIVTIILKQSSGSGMLGRDHQEEKGVGFSSQGHLESTYAFSQQGFVLFFSCLISQPQERY